MREAGSGHGATGSTVTVTLADRSRFETHETSGMLPNRANCPMQIRPSHLRHAAAGMEGWPGSMAKRLMALEDEVALDWLG